MWMQKKLAKIDKIWNVGNPEIFDNFFASKFSDLLTFINFTFPTFTQFVYFHQLFEKWTVKKSKFDSFQKVIFYSLPFVGQLHNCHNPTPHQPNNNLT